MSIAWAVSIVPPASSRRQPAAFVQAVARDLRVHANTVQARRQRIEDPAGLDARRDDALTHLLIAADCGSL